MPRIAARHQAAERKPLQRLVGFSVRAAHIAAAELQKKIEDQMKVVKAAEDKTASVVKDYESLKSQKEKIT